MKTIPPSKKYEGPEQNQYEQANTTAYYTRKRSEQGSSKGKRT